MFPFDSLHFHWNRWRALRAAEAGLPRLAEHERAKIANFKEKFRRLPVAPVTGVPPNAADWNSAMNRLRDLGASADPRAFQRWDVIEARMAHVNSPATADELAALKASADWASRWRPAIREVEIGRPHRYWQYRDSSEVLIQTVYHVMRLELLSGRRVEDWDVVVEFGGGFGGLCRVMHTLGFSGRYWILDLPPFTLLQQYYLAEAGIMTRDSHRVVATSELSDLEAFVATIPPDAAAVFWATWSLSETPVALRERIKPLVARIGNYCLAYQGTYGDVNNTEYFQHHWFGASPNVERIAHRANDYYMANRATPRAGAGHSWVLLGKKGRTSGPQTGF
ncbi:MAG: putative sugar O-methyltransferase [Gemmatimonadota bacterium]